MTFLSAIIIAKIKLLVMHKSLNKRDAIIKGFKLIF